MSDFGDSGALNGYVPFGRSGANPEQNPTVAAVVLSATLRSMRLSRKAKQTAAAEGGKMSPSKLCKLERGTELPGQRDVELLADFYDASSTEKAWLVLLTKLARQPPAWMRAGISPPPFMSHLVGLEPAAEELCTYEVLLLSGLLQTESYMRAVMVRSEPPLDRDEVEERVRLRLYRQAQLFADLPHCVFLLDENILHRRIGTRDTMVDQMDHLAKVAEDTRIQIRILPMDGDQILSNLVSLTRLQFGRTVTGLPSVIYMETHESSKYFAKGDKPEKKSDPSYERLNTTLTKLLGTAADRDVSLEMVRQARQRFSR
ncbi:helix-turn-helix domain-containing protein [Streptomyces sp. Y1]|uniref:Helix-turn-helix domain-containing protein n=1 Tax=Streptomyces sp. Y1 TaxID=3238634 RepID=A0AB39TPK1_9ACTN